MGTPLNNPNAAFGQDALAPRMGTLTAGMLLASAAVAGDVLRFDATVATQVAKMGTTPVTWARAGVALESGGAGETIEVAISGPVMVNKVSGALAVSTAVACSPVTAGQVVALTTSGSLNTHDLENTLVGNVLVAAAAGDTQVFINLHSV